MVQSRQPSCRRNTRKCDSCTKPAAVNHPLALFFFLAACWSLVEANQWDHKKAAADAMAAIRRRHAVITMRRVCPNSFHKAGATDKFAEAEQVGAAILRCSRRGRSASRTTSARQSTENTALVLNLPIMPSLFYNRKYLLNIN